MVFTLRLYLVGSFRRSTEGTSTVNFDSAWRPSSQNGNSVTKAHILPSSMMLMNGDEERTKQRCTSRILGVFRNGEVKMRGLSIVYVVGIILPELLIGRSV